MSLLEELVDYSESCIKDEIPACIKHKWACQRFLNDLERAGTENFPYVFDVKKAEHFLRWMSLFKHTKGVLKGRRIEPHIIQKFVFGNVYGWVDAFTELRRFSKMYWQVARKNAKSQSLGAVGSFELMALDTTCSEIMEVYCAATKKDQAKIVYDECLNMLKRCKLLKGRWKESRGRIIHTKSDSVLRPLSKEDGKKGDGLNPQCGIIDEYHAHDTSEAYDIIDSGMDARAQPLLAIITTAGYNLDHPCFRVEYSLVTKILDPNSGIELDNYFAMVNELDKNETDEVIEKDGRQIAPGDIIDDVNDIESLKKANPILASYPQGIKSLQKKIKEASIEPEKERTLKTKNFNIWINERESSYMDTARWAACKGEIPDLEKRSCYVGLDLSARLDLTSCSFEFKYGDKYIILGHSFLPEYKLKNNPRKDLVPYDLWEKQGWLTVTPGEVVDYDQVIKYIKSTRKKHKLYIEEWCVDPWGTTQITTNLVKEGETVVEVIQGIRTLSEPTKDFKNCTIQKKIIHDGNPVIAWAISNAVKDNVDKNENYMLNKKKSKERIDPLAACINSHVRCITGREYRPKPKVLFY